MTGAPAVPERPFLAIDEIEAAYVAAALKLMIDHYGSRLLPRDRERLTALKARLSAPLQLSDEIRLALDS